MRPRTMACNVIGPRSRRSARGRAHHAGGKRPIPAHTPVARRTSSEQRCPWRDHSAPPAGRAHRHRSGRPCQTAHRSVQPSRAPALEILHACPDSLSTLPAPAQHSCIFWLVQGPLAGHHRRDNACRTSPSRQGPAARLLAGATGDCCMQAPADPRTPAAVATIRAPHCVRAQWWTGSRISSGPSSG